MKIGIRTYQSGGGMSPFTTYTPVTVNNAPASVSTGATETSSDKGSLTDKDFMNMLGQIDGLPSDMNAIFNSITSLASISSIGGLNTSSLNTRYLQALQQIKMAKFNKAEYDKAYKMVTANDGLNEVAINDQGKIVCMNQKGDFKQMSLDEYNKSKGKWQALTNANLLKMRAENAPMDNSFLDIVSNGVGMEQVNKYIQNIISKLQANELGIESYGLIGKSQGQTIIKGANTLQQLASEGIDILGSGDSALEGLYKTGITTKSNINQAKQALQYIYKTLPDNMKTLLEFKTGSKDGAMKAIQEFVGGSISDNKNVRVQMIEDESGKKPGSSTSSKEEQDKAKGNLYSDIVRGIGGSASTFTLQDKNGNSMSVNGVSYPQLGEDLETGSISSFMQKFNSLNRSGKYAITFGNQVLTDQDMENMIFKNDGKAMRAILPVTQNENGQLVPDLNFISEHEDLINKINASENSLKNPEIIQELKQLGIVNDFTGEVDMNKFAPFLLVNGEGTSRNISENNQFVTEIKGNNLDQAIDDFENALYKMKGKDGDQGKEHKFDFDRESIFNPFDLFGMYDKLYKGTIYIPITQNVNQAIRGGNTELQNGVEENYEQAYQMLQQQMNLQNSNSDLLGI